MVILGNGKRKAIHLRFMTLLMAIGFIGMMAGSLMAASTDSVNINLLVTPVVATDLSVSPTFYDFGSVPVNISTSSLTALVLSNDGSVGVSIDKSVWADDSWDITAGTATQDGFNLWAMVASGVPGLVGYEASISSFNESALAAYNALTEGSGTAVSMNPSDTDNLWFRLDMPASVGNTNQKTIQVRLRANPL